MIKNIVLISSVAVLVISAAIWISWPAPGKEERTNTAAVINTALLSGESSFDFGTISMAAGKVSHEFKIRNSSSAPVKITNLSTSCMCTEASLITSAGRKGPFGMPGHGFFNPKIGEIINPGEEGTVEVVFDPAAHGPAGVGAIQRAVYIETAGGGKEIEIKAIVTP